MDKTILEETKIGEFLSVGCEMNDDEVGLFIASADVSSGCGFNRNSPAPLHSCPDPQV